MNDRASLWRPLISALLIAVGLATVWATLAFWAAGTFERLRRSDRVYEYLQISLNGTPVIAARTGTQYLNVSYRSLEGETLDDVDEKWLQPAVLSQRTQEPGWFRTPIGWNERVAGLSDSQRPPTGWYLIRDAEPLGHAYLAGFDALSGLPVGYLGKSGFRPTMPPRDEQFDLGEKSLSWGNSAAASTGYLAPGGLAQAVGMASDELRIPSWHLFVIDGAKVFEADLRERATRAVYESKDGERIDRVFVLTEPEAVRSEARQAAGAVRALPISYRAQDAIVFAAPSTGSGRKTAHRLAVQHADRLTLVDPPSGEQQQYTIPTEMLGHQNLMVYSLAEDGLVLQVQNYDSETGEQAIDLTWLGTDNEVSRREHVELAGYAPTDPRLAALGVAAALPAWLPVWLGSTVLVPFGMLQSHQAASFQEAFWKTMGVAWPGMLATLAIAALVTWFLLRHHRRNYFANLPIWAWFVFLLGVPGWLAYRLHHRQPASASCNACGSAVPRDRPDCAACGSPFPAPAAIGTEIFG